MATKRSAKSSSKTEHVLNLLSSPAQAESGAEGEVMSEKDNKEETIASVQKHVAVPVVEVARNNHENIAGKITDALDIALNEELEQQGSEEPNAATAQSEQSSAPVPDESIEHSEAPSNDESSPQKSDESSAVLESRPLDEEQLKKQLEEEMESSDFVNVMEEVVDGMLDKYIDMFKVCTCQRCHADIKAYTLTKLPSKYVVLSKTTRSPMISYYSRKYEVEVKNQLIFACSVVKDTPRHSADFRKNY